MRALGITALIIVFITVIVLGSMQLRKRRKEKDESVAEVAEVETKKPVIIKAAGIKPINVKKALSNLRSKTKASKIVGMS